MGLIFRVDDVSVNTDFNELKKMLRVVRSNVLNAKIILGVSFFGRNNKDGSVYPDAPFKERPVNWFYKVDKYLPSLHAFALHFPSCEVVSHGLLHVDHTKLSRDAQEMSILTSCELLNTKKFIPPFGRADEVVLDICRDNGIEVIYGEEWRSLDLNDFNRKHQKWYFHAWRFDEKSFCGRFKNVREPKRETSVR